MGYNIDYLLRYVSMDTYNKIIKIIPNTKVNNFPKLIPSPQTNEYLPLYIKSYCKK